LPVVARVLAVSLDDLFGDATHPAGKRGPASHLQRSFERISELPRQKQKFVIEMLETVLAQTAR
jgi:hypothetical protein